MDMFVAMIDVTLKQGQEDEIARYIKETTRHSPRLMDLFQDVYCAHMMALTVY